MEKKLKEEDTPLFDLDDKGLVKFAHQTRNKNVSDTVNSEMMRRLRLSIIEFNKKSSEQTNKMIILTRWIIGLTLALGILTIIQIILLLK